MAVLKGTSGANKLLGGSLADTIFGLGGNDTLKGNGGNDTLLGGPGNDILDGGAGNDRLEGGAGHDKLTGGAGKDRLIGGTGNDTYIISNLGDIVIEGLNAGADKVRSTVTVALAANVEQLTLTGTAAINGTGNGLNNTLTGNAAANAFSGGNGSDTLSGGAGSDKLNGGAGSDNLEGGAGNDTLNGSTGADNLTGSTGNDTYVVDNPGDVVTELAGEGTDLVQSTVDHILADNVENLTLTGAALNGTGNALANTITGNGNGNEMEGGAGNDTLIGGAGDDTLDGQGGADSMVGGEGDDIFNVDDAGDTVDEAGTAGNDGVVSTIVSFSLASSAVTGDVEVLFLSGVTALNGTGNTLNNTIFGNSNANVLDGGAGNDTLNGLDGTDTLQGGAGDDKLQGGFENDTLNGDGGNDTLVGSFGNDLLDLGAMADADLDLVLFNATTEGGDIVDDFTTITGTPDGVRFGGTLNTLFDDIGTGDDDILFVTGNGIDGVLTGFDLANNGEGIFLAGTNGEGVAGANLANATVVASEFNNEFTITGAAGTDALVIVNSTDTSSFSVWTLVEDGTAGTVAAELALLGVFNSNADVTTAQFDFA